MTEVAEAPTRETFKKLMKDIREAARTLSQEEARYLVDLYYSIQDYRIQAGGQVRSSTWAACPACRQLVPFKTSKKTYDRSISPHEIVSAEDAEPLACVGSGAAVHDVQKEPNTLVLWILDEMTAVENEIKKALGEYSQSSPVGRWAESITGVGPVISAGLLAHINIAKAKTAGAIWRFAGLDPTSKWEKKTKRPFNAKLKVLCFKIGESFVKVQNKESDVYGKVFKERKTQEIAKNATGDFKAQAEAKLEKFKIGKTTDAYKAYSTGFLPPAHLHARARRYAVKLFLSHWHHVAFELHYGQLPPKPYIIEHGGHVHFLAPPNWPAAA